MYSVKPGVTFHFFSTQMPCKWIFLGWPVVIVGRPGSFVATNQAQYYISHDIKGLHLRASQLTSDWYFTSANLKLKCIHNDVGFLLECECLWLKANKYYSDF